MRLAKATEMRIEEAGMGCAELDATRVLTLRLIDRAA